MELPEILLAGSIRSRLPVLAYFFLYGAQPTSGHDDLTLLLSVETHLLGELSAELAARGLVRRATTRSFGTTSQIVGEAVCESLDLGAGERVLDE